MTSVFSRFWQTFSDVYDYKSIKNTCSKAIQAHFSNSGCCETSSIQFSQIWINAETKSQPISSTCWAKLCVNSLWTKGNIRKRACCTEKVFLFKIFDLKNGLVGSMNEVGYQIMAQKSFYPLGAFNLGLTRVTQMVTVKLSMKPCL